VAQFPGSRNWGYDGVYAFAAQNSYGGPQGLQRLVNSCHAQGMAVVLDVVYNHLGPEGNYSGDFGFYYTDAYKTPWGAALNFDQEYSDEVRRYFIENALSWITDFHIDGLRLDAVHAIADPSARPFIQELAEQCHRRARELKREVQVIAESNRNDPRVVWPCDRGGWGLDSQWNDDFHHSLRVALTNEKGGYYQDFAGLPELAKALREGFVYTGEYSKFRKKRHGASSRELPGEGFVVFAQNHDQVGNHRMGDRLAAVACFEQLKLAAAMVLLSPYVPLLFMGEEYGEKAPFQYFVSHGDTGLIEAVRKGRREEFASFQWAGEPPDPQDERTYQNSKLHWGSRDQGEHGVLLGFYRELLRLRREIPALAQLAKHSQEVAVLADDHALFLRRWVGGSHIAAAFHFAAELQEVELAIPPGSWRPLLDSSERRWKGPGGELGKVVKSSGKVQLVLKPWSVLLWAWL
jgi:maltooligosyltrehalose trehalohydrolase